MKPLLVGVCLLLARYSLDGIDPVLRVRIGTIDGEGESAEWAWTRQTAEGSW